MPPFRTQVENLVARSGDNAMTAGRAAAEVHTCAERAIPAAQAAALYEQLQDLRGIADIRTLAALPVS